MLTGIGLRNFKAFGEGPNVLAPGTNGILEWMDTAPLSKITLIYGPNSSGKSSVIQSLLLLKQSLKNSYDESRELVVKGEYADMGGIQSLLHNHEEQRLLSIFVNFADINRGDEGPIDRLVMAFSDKSGTAEMSEATYKITSFNSDLLLLRLEMSATTFPLVWDAEITLSDRFAKSYAHMLDETYLPLVALHGMSETRLSVLEQQEVAVEKLEEERQALRGEIETLEQQLGVGLPPSEQELETLKGLYETRRHLIEVQDSLIRALLGMLSLRRAHAQALEIPLKFSQQVQRLERQLDSLRQNLVDRELDLSQLDTPRKP